MEINENKNPMVQVLETEWKNSSKREIAVKQAYHKKQKF